MKKIPTIFERDWNGDRSRVVPTPGNAHAALAGESFSCISLWQPYASLVAIGAKRFETRHWEPPFHLIGTRIAIHAAQRKPTRAELDALSDVCHDAFGFCRWHERIPYGAVVCTVIIGGVYEVMQRLDNGDVRLQLGQVIKDDGFGNYDVGRYCWELKDVDRFDTPVPERGRQGWWTWSAPDAG